MAMRRVLMCLPLCFVLNSCSPPPPEGNFEEVAPPKVEDDGKALPREEAMVRLARTDPIAFLENCIRRYDREVQGYRCTLLKHERLQGKLRPPEEVVCDFRQKPFSVRMEWRKGAEDAARVLYVKGENKDRLLIVGVGWRAFAGIITRDPTGADVRESTRYPPTEFGMQFGTQRTLLAWQAAKERGDLQVVYEGERKIQEVGGRDCWVVKRIGYQKPEDDGILETTYYFDKETWLQVGSVLNGEDGQLIGSYFFRDVVLNPKFDENTFKREGLKK
jgi:hypothetical protein